MTEKEIIARCNTCRNAIYKGDIIWTSQTGQSSGQTVGAYGGTSQHVGQGTTVHGGTYGAKHTGEHSSENWTQCGWCYDQWLAEIVTHEKWQKTPRIVKWGWVWTITALVTGGAMFYAYWQSRENTSLTTSKLATQIAIVGIIFFLISFVISFALFSKPAYSEPTKPNRYRFRVRNK